MKLCQLLLCVITQKVPRYPSSAVPALIMNVIQKAELEKRHGKHSQINKFWVHLLQRYLQLFSHFTQEISINRHLGNIWPEVKGITKQGKWGKESQVICIRILNCCPKAKNAGIRSSHSSVTSMASVIYSYPNIATSLSSWCPKQNFLL